MESITLELEEQLKGATSADIKLATRYAKCLTAMRNGAYTEAESLDKEMQNELGALSSDEIISYLVAIEDSIKSQGGDL